MQNYKYICCFIAFTITACNAHVETIDLSTVPDIPENMLYEQKDIHKELQQDKNEILKDLEKK